MRLLIKQLFPDSYFLPLGSKYSPVLRHPKIEVLCKILQCHFYDDELLHPTHPPVGCLRLFIQYIRSYPLSLGAASTIRKLNTLHAVVTRHPLIWKLQALMRMANALHVLPCNEPSLMDRVKFWEKRSLINLYLYSLISCFFSYHSFFSLILSSFYLSHPFTALRDGGLMEFIFLHGRRCCA
jgi:hypothetical protein